MNTVVVTGSFDNLRSRHIRFLEEAAKVGSLHVLLWSDAAVAASTGKPPKFPEAERLYLVQAVRYVRQATLVDAPIDPDVLPDVAGLRPDTWAVGAADDSPAKRAFCAARGLAYCVFSAADLQGFPDAQDETGQEGPSSTVRRPSVVVTGCYDWLHSGHVRFFEEVSQLGDLYVVVGHDENVRLLKGEGHPLFPEDERRYVAGSIRYVKQALVSSGHGWMDAEPEIERLKPAAYAVNEDGDKPEKRAFCAERGMEYIVLMRTPKEGLPRRASTDLRGF